MSRQKRERNWVCTLFFEQADEAAILENGNFEKELLAEIHNRASLKYCIGQLERCPETGRLHFQFYIECTNPITLAGLKHKLPNGTHLEARKGTAQQAIDYCSKEASREREHCSIGEPPKQGKRSDLAAIWDDVKSGESVNGILERHPCTALRYLKSITTAVSMQLPDRDFKTFVIWCWGPTGSGKSKYCLDNYPGAYWKPGNKWWDNYDPSVHSTVVWDVQGLRLLLPVP